MCWSFSTNFKCENLQRMKIWIKYTLCNIIFRDIVTCNAIQKCRLVRIETSQVYFSQESAKRPPHFYKPCTKFAPIANYNQKTTVWALTTRKLKLFSVYEGLCILLEHVEGEFPSDCYQITSPTCFEFRTKICLTVWCTSRIYILQPFQSLHSSCISECRLIGCSQMMPILDRLRTKLCAPDLQML